MEKEKIYSGVIYKVTNIQNKKCYIGKTTKKDYLKYIDGHFKDAFEFKDITEKKVYGKYFYNAIRKYGKQNFKIQILGQIFVNSIKELNENLNEAEIESIWIFRSFGENGKKRDSIYGYNCTKGGDGVCGLTGKDSWNFGRKIPKEQTAKQMATYKENNKNNQYGKAHSIRLKETDLNKNRTWVFIELEDNTYDERWIDKNELQIYLDKGFIEGRKPDMKFVCNKNFKKSDNCKERIWINKNGENKRVKEQDLEKYLLNNWIIGVSNTILDFEIIKNLLDQKLSYTKIAKQLDVSRGYLIKFVKNYDIDFYNESLKRIHKNRTCSNFVNSKRNKGNYTIQISNELLIQMKQEHDSGLQFKQLAEKYNITWWIISRRLKTLEANINE